MSLPQKWDDRARAVRLTSAELKSRDEESTESLVRSEITVLPCPGTFESAIGLKQEDDLWDRVYSASYRRIFRVGKVKGLPFTTRAAICADVIVYRMVPYGDRPKEWPGHEAEIARKHGISVTQMRVYLGQAKAQAWLDRSPWRSEELVKQVDDRMFNRTMLALDEGAKDAANLAAVLYKRFGKIGPTVQTNVQIGNNSMTVNVGTPGEQQERLNRLVNEYNRQKAREVDVSTDAVEVSGEDEEVPRGSDHPSG